MNGLWRRSATLGTVHCSLKAVSTSLSNGSSRNADRLISRKSLGLEYVPLLGFGKYTALTSVHALGRHHSAMEAQNIPINHGITWESSLWKKEEGNGPALLNGLKGFRAHLILPHSLPVSPRFCMVQILLLHYSRSHLRVREMHLCEYPAHHMSFDHSAVTTTKACSTGYPPMLCAVVRAWKRTLFRYRKISRMTKLHS